VAVLAFTAWGTGQVVHSPAAASVFNDAAILLFAIDGGAAVLAEARATLAHYRHSARATPPHLRLQALRHRQQRGWGRGC